MEDDDSPLDFESEDQLLSPSPLATNKRRRKVIGLDDLVSDYYKEKLVERERKKVSKCYDSDEDEENTRESKEQLLCKFVADCQKQVGISAEDEIPLWGLRVFGHKKEPPSLSFPGLESCELIQSFSKNELHILLELEAENGEGFMEGLLISGWLANLVFKCSRVEELIASWTFNLMLYSSNEELQSSACDFWLAILAFDNEVNAPLVTVERLPRYKELRNALEIYGYLPDAAISLSSLSVGHSDPVVDGPSQNISSWIKCLAACCRFRSIQAIFSASEVEDFLCVTIQLFLDRRLQGLSLLLDECLLSIVSFFTNNEWITSSKNVATSLAKRAQKDMNCLRIVECICGVNTRTKHLKSELAFHILINFFETKVTDPVDILRLMVSINIKDNRCDISMIYICLILAENWLSNSCLLEQRPVLEMWGLYLRNCSCQISSTDWRSYASKVRNKAAYLLQTTARRNFE